MGLVCWLTIIYIIDVSKAFTTSSKAGSTKESKSLDSFITHISIILYFFLSFSHLHLFFFIDFVSLFTNTLDDGHKKKHMMNEIFINDGCKKADKNFSYDSNGRHRKVIVRISIDVLLTEKSASKNFVLRGPKKYHIDSIEPQDLCINSEV